MNEETKNLIMLDLKMLKETCIKNGVSMAVDASGDGKIIFFDTFRYLKSKKFDGIEVSLVDLVR